jgi:hypothetical protein
VDPFLSKVPVFLFLFPPKGLPGSNVVAMKLFNVRMRMVVSRMLLPPSVRAPQFSRYAVCLSRAAVVQDLYVDSE